MILKMASVTSIHSCSSGAPIRLEEAVAAGVRPTNKGAAATPAGDKVPAPGRWNSASDPFLELEPVWTDEFMAAGAAVYGRKIFSAKEVEPLKHRFRVIYTCLLRARAGTSKLRSRRNHGGDHGRY